MLQTVMVKVDALDHQWSNPKHPFRGVALLIALTVAIAGGQVITERIALNSKRVLFENKRAVSRASAETNHPTVSQRHQLNVMM